MSTPLATVPVMVLMPEPVSASFWTKDNPLNVSQAIADQHPTRPSVAIKAAMRAVKDAKSNDFTSITIHTDSNIMANLDQLKSEGMKVSYKLVPFKANNTGYDQAAGLAKEAVSYFD